MQLGKSSLLLGSLPLRERSKVIVAVDTGVMAVVPKNSYGVIAYCFDGIHLQFRLIDTQWVGIRRPFLRRGPVGAGAGGAGTFAAKEFEREGRMGAIDPVDLNPLGLADSDVFRFGLRLVVGTHSG